MASVSYAPGGGTAMVGDSCWMLIDAAPDSAVVAEIWRRMAQGPRLDALVAGLLQFGFAFLPDFALLMAADGRRHVICRGGGRATLVTASGGSTGIDGTGPATWLDYPVPPDAVAIVLGEPPAESGLRLPAAAGVFLASGVIVSLADEAAARPSSGSPPVIPSPNVTSLHPFPASGQPELARPAVRTRPDLDPGADEGTPDDRAYDFLWEHTQMRSVEDAAIRPDSGDSLFSLQVPDFGVPPAPVAPADVPPPAGGQSGLIDSVPGWAAPGPAQPRLPVSSLIQAVTEPVDPPTSHSAPPETIGVSQLPRPPQPPPAQRATTTIAGGPGGTGELPENTATTIRRSELRPPLPAATIQDQIGPTVQALLCMRSHLLAGRSPFEVPGGDNSTLALMRRIQSQDPPRTGRADEIRDTWKEVTGNPDSRLLDFKSWKVVQRGHDYLPAAADVAEKAAVIVGIPVAAVDAYHAVHDFARSDVNAGFDESAKGLKDFRVTYPFGVALAYINDTSERIQAAIAFIVGGAWCAPLPTANENDEASLVPAILRGRRSLVIRGLASEEGIVEGPATDVIKRLKVAESVYTDGFTGAGEYLRLPAAALLAVSRATGKRGENGRPEIATRSIRVAHRQASVHQGPITGTFSSVSQAAGWLLA